MARRARALDPRERAELLERHAAAMQAIRDMPTSEHDRILMLSYVAFPTLEVSAAQLAASAAAVDEATRLQA